jgi:hypothetical protein
MCGSKIDVGVKCRCLNQCIALGGFGCCSKGKRRKSEFRRNCDSYALDYSTPTRGEETILLKKIVSVSEKEGKKWCS